LLTLLKLAPHKCTKDAIIFKDPLPHTLKDQILDAMRVQTKNPYWNLKEEMYHRIEDI
jgi:hypothetical protein